MVMILFGRSIDKGYIREVGPFSIARAFIFDLEVPFSYLSVSGEKFKPGYLSVSGEKFKSLLRRKV